MSKIRKTKMVSVYLSATNPLEARIAKAVEEKRPIQIADMLYVSGPELVKGLAIKGLVMVEREFPEQFDTNMELIGEKVPATRRKRLPKDRSDRSALDVWGGATT